MADLLVFLLAVGASCVGAVGLIVVLFVAATALEPSDARREREEFPHG